MLRAAALVLSLLSLVGCAGCAGPTHLRGFTEAEARAAPMTPEVVDTCDARSGHLVVEVASALIREYPHPGRDETPWRKQPIMLAGVSGEPGVEADGDLLPFGAPEEYRAGDGIRAFEGRRLLDRSIRILHGRAFDLRLAQNHHTFAPRWTEYVKAVGGGLAGAASIANLPSPSPDVIAFVVDLIRAIDRDSLILRWRVDLDSLVAALGQPPYGRALRYPLRTSRNVGTGPFAGRPAADLDLLVYIEPEPGCPRFERGNATPGRGPIPGPVSFF